MFDLLSFIDSKDIREYNRDTHFFPMEQAVIIWHSKQTTVKEKLAAWHELLETYSEEEFQKTRGGKKKYGDRSNKQILLFTVEAYEQALADTARADGMVYETVFYEAKYPDNDCRNYFSDYASAMQYIKELKQEYLDDPDMKEERIQAQISAKPMNTNDPWWENIFYFDSQLRMTDISTIHSCGEYEDWGMDSFFVYVPLPFKRGDILRTIDSEEIEYGAMPETPDETYFAAALQHGDASDMNITPLQFYYDDGQWKFGFDHYHFLRFEKCPDGELPEEQSILYLIRDVYQEKLSLMSFLVLYSHHGKEAYHEWHGK